MLTHQANVRLMEQRIDHCNKMISNAKRRIKMFQCKKYYTADILALIRDDLNAIEAFEHEISELVNKIYAPC